MVGYGSAAVARLLPIAGAVLVLCLGMSGCEQAGDTSAEGQKQAPTAPAGSSTAVPEAGQAVPEGAAAGSAPAANTAGEAPAAGATMSAEEISRHFKVKTTDAARAAAEGVEAAGKKAEAAVEEATR